MTKINSASIIDTTRHDTTRHDTTVVVPVYNVEKYLPSCIDSIISQTYKNFRVVLVDDGSTDSSGKICDEYSHKDSRTSVIHKENGGLSSARNAGLRSADTKYIYFIDSDDFIDPEAINILHTVSEQNNLDVLCFDSDVSDEEGVTQPLSSYYVRKGSYIKVMAGRELFGEFMKNYDYAACVPMHFYSREFLVNNNLTFKEGIIHEDELFTFIALLSARRAMHIPARLYNRRIRSGSIMTKPRTQLNSDSMYIILHTVLHEYGKFREDISTRAAYDMGVKYLAFGYFGRYMEVLSVQDEKGQSQYREITKELKSLGYDFSGIERRIKLKPLYDLKALAVKITGLKLAKKAVKKVLRHALHYIRPKLDDECRGILAKLRDTNRPDIKRLITLCVPRHGNRGDIAIALAQRRLFTKNFPEHVLIELPGELCREYPHLIIKNLNTRDIIMTNGGGWFGTLWRHDEIEALNILRHFKSNRIIIMPQTVYYSDDEQGRRELEYDRKAFAKFSDFHVFVRDRNSYELIGRENLYPNAKSVNLIPDMVCSMDFQNLAPEKRSGVLVCFRPDPEKVMDSREQNKIYARLMHDFEHVGFFTTNPALLPVKIHDWENALTELLKRIAAAELVVTDRLHGMIFAAITGTPCVAFDNVTGKVHSVHEWLEGCEYIQVCRNANEFDGAVKRALNAPHKWDNSGLMEHFRKITDLII